VKETTNHKLRYPEPKDPDTLAAYWESLAKDTERELDAIAPKQITGAAKKQLLIANSSGVVTAVTASGDVTNDDAGVFTIGNEKVESKHVKDGTLTRGDLSAEAKPFTWYAPKNIATEESRENIAFGVLATSDEIANVVMPENGLILVGYAATWKSSVSGAGNAAIFLGANQIKAPFGVKGVPRVAAANTQGTAFSFLGSSLQGLVSAGEEFGTSQVTTGQLIGFEQELKWLGGFAVIFAEKGTYNVSIRFAAGSGKVTAKERKLWVATLGY
jgi:hypothetical protein